jgi:hypothetical protein
MSRLPIVLLFVEIDQPSLAGYIVPAGRGTGAAVAVCPGGG